MPNSDVTAPRDVRRLISTVYHDLRAIARNYLGRQRAGGSLRPTELVNEACVCLLRHGQGDWVDTGHFRAIAVRKLGQVLADHWKDKAALKRGGSGIGVARDGHQNERAARQRVPVETLALEARAPQLDLLDLADALRDLERTSPRLHEGVMLHWFGGLSHTEIATRFQVSRSTVEKDFRYALAWLSRRLAGADPDGD